MTFSADSPILSNAIQGTQEQCGRFILARPHGEYTETDIAGGIVPAYFAEGIVRAWSETGAAARLAQAEVALALAFFVSAIAYVRAVR